MKNAIIAALVAALVSSVSAVSATSFNVAARIRTLERKVRTLEAQAACERYVLPASLKPHDALSIYTLTPPQEQPGVYLLIVPRDCVSAGLVSP